jgi:hypothetical protein
MMFNKRKGTQSKLQKPFLSFMTRCLFIILVTVNFTHSTLAQQVQRAKQVEFGFEWKGEYYVYVIACAYGAYQGIVNSSGRPTFNQATWYEFEQTVAGMCSDVANWGREQVGNLASRSFAVVPESSPDCPRCSVEAQTISIYPRVIR